MPIVDEDKYHIPIFVIMHDRIEIPKQCIRSYLNTFKSPIRLIFHDTKSIYKPGINYIKSLEKNGHKVYWDKINDYKRVMVSVKDYLKEHPQCEYYVITDPDIKFQNTPGDVLDLYILLCEQYGHKRAVGPMLRIDDIPNYYPYKDTAIKRQRGMFWIKKRKKIKWKNKTIEYIETSIDSTFQLAHRSYLGTLPRRAIRVCGPYWAKHLDWYLNPKTLSPDQKFYSKNSSGITHWGRNIHNLKKGYNPFKKSR